jgi:hypothetical protein
MPPPEPTRMGGKFGGVSSASPPVPNCGVSDSQSSTLQTMAPRGECQDPPTPVQISGVDLRLGCPPPMIRPLKAANKSRFRHAPVPGGSGIIRALERHHHG